MIEFNPGTINNNEKLLVKASKLNLFESKIYHKHVLVGSFKACGDDKLYDCIAKGFEVIAKSLNLKFDEMNDITMMADIRDSMLSAILKANDKDIVIGTNKVN